MINFTFTAWPEMLAWPYLMLHGWLPYKDIAIAHNPLLLLDLVVFYKIFGVGIIQLKIYTWLLIGLNTYFTFFVAAKYWNKRTGFLASFLYLILCIVYQGNGLWFDLALTPFALLLYYFLKEKKYIWAGIIFALGFLTKQTFIYFLAPVGIVMIKANGLKISKYVKFVLGSGIIIAFFIVLLGFLGILDDYYYWAIKFGIFYLPNAAGQISLPNIKQFAFAVFPFLVAVFSMEYLALGFAFVGAFGVYPRWEMFHFQPALPFLAMVISIFIFSKKNMLIKLITLLLFVVFVVMGIYRNLGGETRFYESDVQKVQNYIIYNHYSSVYIINYWDNIYALTNTLPNKPLVPYIPWYLSYGINKELIINNLKLKMPETIVIGERDKVFPDLYFFVDKFYECKIVEKRVELCIRNK